MPTKTANLRTLARIVQEFRVVDNELPVSYASIILQIAKHERERGEDPTIGDISDALGMARPSMSRATQALSTRTLGNNPKPDPKAPKRRALGIIERYPDERDLRVMRCALTEKGRALVHRLEDHLGG
jgi:DNA-binding MarR family transcriptional regulator